MKNPIHITSQDKERLEKLLVDVEAKHSLNHHDLTALREEMHRAVILDPAGAPPDLITMNSRADILDLDSGETVTFALVFPSEADVDEGKISVLAPIGSGMLGYRVGDEFEWEVPAGIRRMRVTRVSYQPEAAGEFHR